jgi:hypothetical protein
MRLVISAPSDAAFTCDLIRHWSVKEVVPTGLAEPIRERVVGEPTPSMTRVSQPFGWSRSSSRLSSERSFFLGQLFSLQLVGFLLC